MSLSQREKKYSNDPGCWFAKEELEVNVNIYGSFGRIMHAFKVR